MATEAASEMIPPGDVRYVLPAASAGQRNEHLRNRCQRAPTLRSSGSFTVRSLSVRACQFEGDQQQDPGRIAYE